MSDEATGPVGVPLTRGAIPAGIDGMTDAERDELATAYLDLFGKIIDALNACDHDVAFVWFNGRGLKVTGHMPEALQARLAR